MFRNIIPLLSKRFWMRDLNSFKLEQCYKSWRYNLPKKWEHSLPFFIGDIKGMIYSSGTIRIRPASSMATYTNVESQTLVSSS